MSRSVHWLGLSGTRYEEINASGLIPLGPEALAAAIDWPPVD